MEIIGPLLISTIAGLSTVIGALIIFVKIPSKYINKFISFCLSFSVSIMIGISITDLVPESLKVLFSKNIHIGLIIAITSFIIGVFLMKILTSKINKIKINSPNLYKLGILNMIALMLHNFPEGIATFLSSYQNIYLGFKLSIAIMLHNIPEGISIAVPIYYSTNNKKEALKKTFLSGLAEPLGAILAFLIFRNIISSELISIILMFVAGIMVTISIEEIFPEAKKYRENKYILLGLFTGLILIIINHCFM